MEYFHYATETPLKCLVFFLIAMLSIGFIKSLYVYFRYHFGRFADHPFLIIPFITMEFFVYPYILAWDSISRLMKKLNLIKERTEAEHKELDKTQTNECLYEAPKASVPLDRDEKIAYYTQMLENFDRHDERKILTDYIKTL